MARPKSRILAWPLLGDEDVCGLDVAVNDSLGVGGSECVGDFDSPVEHVIQWQGLAGDAMLQRGAFHVFHGDERLAVLIADFVDGADVGMIQCGRCSRLSSKAFESLRVLGHVFGKKFERDKTTEGGILRFVDDTHAAAAELFDDAVVRDGLADHWVNGRGVNGGETTILREAVEMGKWSFDGTSVLLFRVEKLLEVHLEFEVVSTGGIDVCGAVLRGHFQGAVEQRLEALPEFGSHIEFTAADDCWCRLAARLWVACGISGNDGDLVGSSCRLVAVLSDSAGGQYSVAANEKGTILNGRCPDWFGCVEIRRLFVRPTAPTLGIRVFPGFDRS